ncbi:MAG: choice-of-anchor Q domain-containing protein [Candidatus Sumerlaeia bacterium]|nr:choice-of-anchor Q domain-containing protein [Candidatus Sumerlaeia bacterium]
MNSTHQMNWCILQSSLFLGACLSQALGAELLVPSQFATIQGAVDAAADGDIITISPGTYIENIKLKGSNLTFRSIEPDNLEIRNSTQLHLPTSDSLFDFTQFPVSWEFRFEGLFLRGSSPNYGGSIKGIPEIQIAVNNCTFYSCGASFEGGAIFNTKGIIRNSTFELCRVITGVSSAGSTYGGAISEFDGLIENCDFIDNFSDGVCRNNQGNQTCSFGNGGAIAFSSGTIRNCRFSRNRSTDTGGAIEGFNGLIEDCFFELNNARNFGGAISGIGEHSLINRCVFVRNSAVGTGAISNCEGNISNSLFVSNSATVSAGVSSNVFGAYTNCVFYGNSAGSFGSTLGGSYGPIVNCIFWNNRSRDGTLFGNVFLSDIRNCLIQGWEPDDRGNINAPPSFIDPTLDSNNRPRDFRLRPDSPAIDRGLRVFDSGSSVSQALQFDADGNPRPVVNYPTDIFNRGDGFGTDIGAYEHQTVYDALPSTEVWVVR